MPTIRPSLVPKHKELVPVFYQRNPNKTRNCIAQSSHAIAVAQENRAKSDMGFVQDPDQLVDCAQTTLSSMYFDDSKSEL